jgi:penicillin V acylase-like amidase (Ntn superfamily)
MIKKRAMTRDKLGVDDTVSLTLSQGTVFGHEYSTVAPINAGVVWNNMVTWMIDTFGTVHDIKGVITPNQRWYVNNAKFWFREQKDLTMFLLRWS